MKKIAFLLCAVVLLAWSSSQAASEMARKEAINYYNAGVRAQKDGNLQEMKASYTKIFILDPENKELKKLVLHNYGVLYMKSGNYAKAEENFLDVLKMDPNFEAAKKNLGLIYDKTRSKLEALEYWLKFFNIDVNKMKPQNPIMADEKPDQPF
ncbi:MAG: tetratricopeptide repeat protein [Candidatus Omnitrophica bacterium]|jgi:tetratricopeptide (TPR) repeat protein|nr:tetratricopeptide repeat protein [Candidatus Omnitrophota bacterium]